MQDHYRGTFESVVLEIGGVVIFAGIMTALSRFVQPSFGPLALIVVGVLLALVPAVLWLVAFYRQDRLEPEPRQYVIGIFLLTMLLAQSVGQPLIRNVFGVQNLTGGGLLTEWLVLVLVVGLIQTFVIYAAVRYTIFRSAEFDQRVDGIIYGASAALGYATLLNIQYIIGNNGVDIGVGAVRVAVQALSFAAFGGVLGYFLGRAKFDHMGALWLPAGLLVGALLNGSVSLLLQEITTIGSLSFNPWYGLVAATIIAGSVFAGLLRTIQQLNAAKPLTGGAR